MAGPTFPVAIAEDGAVRAGGLTLCHLSPSGDLIFPDRYRDRCMERGTLDVHVDVVDLLLEIYLHLQGQIERNF